MEHSDSCLLTSDSSFSPRVSIIIPACNAAGTICECVEACLRQTYPVTDIIVVDDGSADGTLRIAETFPIHCVRQENRGPAAARNHGAREARGDVLAFTDADCVPRPDWIERLVAGFDSGVVAVGGTYGIANPECLLAKMVHEEIATRHSRFDDEVDFVGSFNVAYRREAFEAVGGFDEQFPCASAEDNDLAYRLTDAGGRLRFARDAVVGHYHPVSLGPYLRTQMRHGFWRVKLYAKHPHRARQGDRYAGLADLAAPPVALAAFFLTVVLAFLGWWKALGIVLAVSVALCATARMPLAARMFMNTKDPRMLLFVAVAALRDMARGVGMIAGLWRWKVGRL